MKLINFNNHTDNDNNDTDNEDSEIKESDERSNPVESRRKKLMMME
jgi:hypothetical protein